MQCCFANVFQHLSCKSQCTGYCATALQTLHARINMCPQQVKWNNWDVVLLKNVILQNKSIRSLGRPVRFRKHPRWHYTHDVIGSHETTTIFIGFGCPRVHYPCHGPNGGTQRIEMRLCMQDACSFGRTYHSFSPRLASADLKKGVMVNSVIMQLSVWTTCIHSQIGLKEIWANWMFPCRYAIPSSWIARASSSVLMYDQLMMISERDQLGTTLFEAGVWKQSWLRANALSVRNVMTDQSSTRTQVI